VKASKIPTQMEYQPTTERVQFVETVNINLYNVINSKKVTSNQDGRWLRITACVLVVWKDMLLGMGTYVEKDLRNQWVQPKSSSDVQYIFRMLFGWLIASCFLCNAHTCFTIIHKIW
jgi:hypothetical protein